jgi:hypothetical protein
MQLAHGWTTLAIKTNIFAVAAVVPALLWIVPKYGAMGAVWVWVALNTGYMLVQISLMHLRLLPSEKWSWYSQDVAMPLAAAAATVGLCHWAIPTGLGSLKELSVVLTASSCVLASAAFSAPMVRKQITRHLSSTIKSLYKRQ